MYEGLNVPTRYNCTYFRTPYHFRSFLYCQIFKKISLTLSLEKHEDTLDIVCTCSQPQNSHRSSENQTSLWQVKWKSNWSTQLVPRFLSSISWQNMSASRCLYGIFSWYVSLKIGKLWWSCFCYVKAEHIENNYDLWSTQYVYLFQIQQYFQNSNDM